MNSISNQTYINTWLYTTIVMVVLMILIGGITRLTDSGLSMVEWRPIWGFLPPITDEEWKRVFSLYMSSPEYIFKNQGMSIIEFKKIFFWEYFHRIWGRLIGLTYTLPLIYFWLTNKFTSSEKVFFSILLLFGASQAFMGWYMVKSGLTENPDVSHFRLSAHLFIAFLIYSMLFFYLSLKISLKKNSVICVKMNYSIVAPRMYDGRIESLVKRITGFADMIQLTHLKLQQVMSRMVPDGVYLDADGLAEVDLGNGTNYNPQEALNMFFQTGSVIGRSFTQDGDINPGKVPIQEITSGSGGNKMQALIANYNYYLQMIRDTTGLNEARDGTMPDKNALVGIQKIAAANSNTATRHILQSGLFLTAETAEKVSLRISDILEYSPTADAFVQAIGAHNVATLDEIKELHLYDFGIFINLQPDEEEKAMLENNIQMALQQKNIELEDAIDIREIKNIKLANQLLKIRRKKKQNEDRQMQLQNIQAQTQSNTQAAQAAAQIEVQKNQAIVQNEAQMQQLKAQIDSQKMQQEVEFKKELMALEFQYNMQLKGIETEGMKNREKEKEDRKDERTKIQATQQSELIDQRKTGKPPKNFESTSNDILSGDFSLGSFDPR